MGFVLGLPSQKQKYSFSCLYILNNIIYAYEKINHILYEWDFNNCMNEYYNSNSNILSPHYEHIFPSSLFEKDDYNLLHIVILKQQQDNNVRLIYFLAKYNQIISLF